MTRSKDKAQLKYPEPGEAKGVIDLRTFAEQTKDSGVRDDERMIYEMMHISQYSDGSVLDAEFLKTFTAQQVAESATVIVLGDGDYSGYHPENLKLGKLIAGDIKRNAKAAIKNGTTTNLAPRVK
jgi:hypothetical protein